MIELQSITPQILQNALQSGITIITANNRLSQNICREFDNSLLKQNRVAWSSADCLPLHSWLLRHWESALLAGLLPKNSLLLSHEQEQILWLNIITNSHYANGLLRIAATAKSASDAWCLLQQWKLQRNESDYQLNEDWAAFHSWANEFEVQCREQNWWLHVQLAQIVEELISEHSLSIEPELWITGFESFTPQQQQLFESLLQSGCRLKQVQLTSHSQSVQCVACNDTRHEIETVAHWSRQQLEQNSATCIGIVIADLASVRDIVVQSFERVLQPSTSESGTSLQQTPWNISLGLPLADYSIIRIAFQLLELNKTSIDISTVSSVLRSAHLFGAKTEACQRALLDRLLSDLGEPLVSLQSLLYFSSQQNKPYACPIFASQLALLCELKQNCPNRANTQYWTQWMIDWLKAVGWATGRTLSTDEYQTLEAWAELLPKFAALQIVTDYLTYAQALSILHRFAAQRIYQIQSPDAPIQILGVYETIGLQFDKLWVMGLHDVVWPTYASPTPFIPTHIQKLFKLPHANRQNELLITKNITTRLLNSAAQVIVSYPSKNTQQILRKSPLIEIYPTIALDSLAIVSLPSWNEKIQQQALLQELIDDVAPPLLQKEQQKSLGGSNIFKNQSLCPFRAFAENRLNAKPIPVTQAGLDAMKRGSLLHTVLELFWKKVRTQQQLLSKNSQQLSVIVNENIDQAIVSMAKIYPKIFNKRFTELEKQRLNRVVLEWLELEKKREDFSVVDIEKKHEVNLKGVNVKLIIDRVDQLQDGRRIIIDYKSATVFPSEWFGERPAEPQLPLYSVIVPNDIAAVLFAQIKPGDLKFSGIVEQTGIIADLPPNNNRTLKNATETWPNVLQEWDETICKLAKEFKSGYAKVDPRDNKNTCKKLYCELSMLCRIDELLLVNVSTDVESE